MELSFFLKKLIGALLLPVPIILFLLAIGLILLITPYRKTAAGFLVSGFAILCLFSFKWLPNTMLYHLERGYPPIKVIPKEVTKIVVLGGGVRDDLDKPPNTQLSSASLSRLIEAIRLYRLAPRCDLILSGGRAFGSLDESMAMMNVAHLMGVPKSHITLENGSRDTREEVLYLKKKIGQQPFLLVTSAFHMQRALALFTSDNMHPIAAPTQFLVRVNNNNVKYYLPSANNIIHVDIAIHEYLGLLWSKINGHA